MASGCLVVTPDCVGNRGFCRHEDHCSDRDANMETNRGQFLGVSEHVRIEPEIVFEGDRGDRMHRAVSPLLRVSYLVELARLYAFLRVRGW